MAVGKKKGKVFWENNHQTIVDMRANNKSYSEIARTIGVRESSICLFVRRILGPQQHTPYSTQNPPIFPTNSFWLYVRADEHKNGVSYSIVKCSFVIDGRVCDKEWSVRTSALIGGHSLKCRDCNVECNSRRPPKPKEQWSPLTKSYRGVDLTNDEKIFIRKYKRDRLTQRKSTILGSAKQLHVASKERARQAGIPFDLEVTWIASKISDGCEMTGRSFILFNESGGRTNLDTASLDKIDPSKGYTKDNVRVVTWEWNHWKSDKSEAEAIERLLRMARDIEKKQKSKKAKAVAADVTRLFES